MTRYGFRQALGGFFPAETAALRRLLPAGLTPVEVHPGQSVLAVTVFDFVESEVGAYGELVISVVVPPFAPKGDPLPDSAFFPVALATTTDASRRHAAERWRLPEYARCVDVRFTVDDDAARAVVQEGGRTILALQVGRTAPAPSARLYQCFASDGAGVHRVPVRILGTLDEHEEEHGELELADDHPLTGPVRAALEDTIPFREQYMGAGEQHFGALVPHAGGAR